MADILEMALRNEEFGKDCMENPEVANTALAIVDRIIDWFGKDIHQAKIEGPNMAREGFDIAFKLTSKGGK